MEVREQIEDLYTKYPFPGPGIIYTVPSATHIMGYLADAGFLTRSAPRFLDAGCGTGETALGVAMALSSATVVGVDLSAPAIESAKTRAAEMGLANATFQQGDLAMALLPGPFDLILLSGVLHHIEDPAPILRRLRDLLTDDGRIIIWLYGDHGRRRLRANREFLSILLKDVDDAQERLGVAKAFLEKTKTEYAECYFSTPNGDIDGNWQQSVDWVLANDPWLVDQFLHPFEVDYTMPSVLRLLGESGLELDRWLGIDVSAARTDLGHEDVQTKFDNLPRHEQLAVIDELIKPASYTVVARKEA